jgi:hypothetical protein
MGTARQSPGGRRFRVRASACKGDGQDSRVADAPMGVDVVPGSGAVPSSPGETHGACRIPSAKSPWNDCQGTPLEICNCSVDGAVDMNRLPGFRYPKQTQRP